MPHKSIPLDGALGLQLNPNEGQSARKRTSFSKHQAYTVDSLVTDPMFKGDTSSAAPEDPLLYENSLGNLTYKTISDYQNLLALRQENSQNQSEMIYSTQQPGSHYGHGLDPILQQSNPASEPPNFGSDLNVQDKLNQHSIVGDFENKTFSQLRDESLSPTQNRIFGDDHLRNESSPLRDHSIEAKMRNEQNEVEATSPSYMTYARNPHQDEQRLPNQREIYEQNLRQMHHLAQQHDFQKDALGKSASEQMYAGESTHFGEQSNLLSQTPTEMQVMAASSKHHHNPSNQFEELKGSGASQVQEEGEVELGGVGNITMADGSKKKKKKGKKKKKKNGMNMTVAVDDSQYYDYTVMGDDVISEDKEPFVAARQSQKNLKSIVHGSVNGNNPTPHLGKQENDYEDTSLSKSAYVKGQIDEDPFSPGVTNQRMSREQIQRLEQQVQAKQVQAAEEYEYNRSMKSYEENVQSRHQSLTNLQQELHQIERDQNQNLTQGPIPGKSKKFRQQKVVSQEINSKNMVDPNSEQSVVQVHITSNQPSRKDSANSNNQAASPNIHVVKHHHQQQSNQIFRIQDGAPPFNTSTQTQMKFHSQSQLKFSTHLPDIHSTQSPAQGHLQSVLSQQNFSKTTPPLRQSQGQAVKNRTAFEESKLEDSQDMHMRSDGNLPFVKNHKNQNYMIQNSSSYYQQDTPLQMQGSTPQYNKISPYSIQPHLDSEKVGNIGDLRSGGRVNQFDSINENFVSSPGSRVSNASARNSNMLGMDPQMSPILQQGLQDQCKYHPSEQIKYFCRDQGCLKGLCPDCIIEHSKHDFIAANELAAFEIRQVVKQAQRRCKNQVKIQKELKSQTEKKLSSLNRQRSEEFNRLHIYFNELHKELEERESQLNALFNEEVKDSESQLMKDMQTIQQIYTENVKLFKRLKLLQEQQSVSNDAAVVGNAELAYYLNNLTTQNDLNVTGKQFYVQLQENASSDIAVPSFSMDLTNEKQKVRTMGQLVQASFNEFFGMNRSKPGAHSQRPSASFPTLEEAQNFADQLTNQNMTSLTNQSNQKALNSKFKDAQTQTLEGTQLAGSSSILDQAGQQQQDAQYVANKNMYWFRWDTSEVYRLNPETHKWQMRTDIKNSSKFLYFSSIVHLTQEMGCFLIGGSDNENNFSKRVQYFCKYNVFIEKPPMINKRAFFPSLFSKLDNSIYALGGSENTSSDLNKCEKFSLIENVWRPIAPMNLHRNGMGAVILEQYRLIFTFGGNNHRVGSLCKIEKYEIDFDKWTLISLQMRHSVHDLSAFNLGKERILLFGGHSNTEPSKNVEMIDLSFECFKTKQGKRDLTLKDGGKTYFPPFYDPNSGKLQMLFGYCDSQPHLEEVDISDLVIHNQLFNNYVSAQNSVRGGGTLANINQQSLGVLPQDVLSQTLQPSKQSQTHKINQQALTLGHGTNQTMSSERRAHSQHRSNRVVEL